METKKAAKGIRRRKSLTSNVSSKREQSRDFHLLCLHELNLTLLSLVELLLGFGALRLESLLQFSYPLHSRVAINWG